jgi:HYR domain/IPTL-CTERM motif
MLVHLGSRRRCACRCVSLALGALWILRGSVGWAAPPQEEAPVQGVCTLTCPANPMVNNDLGQCGAVVNYAAPTASGSCGPITCVPASGSMFAVGSTAVSCTEGNGGNCSFDVIVADVEPPVVTCPADVEEVAPVGQSSLVINYAPPMASDNCPGPLVVCLPPSGSSFPTGTTTATCTVTDGSANTAQCSFLITVIGQIPTLGAWGLGALSLALGLLGAWRLGRRLRTSP